MVGRCIPYWNGHFLGDMLVFRGVNIMKPNCIQCRDAHRKRRYVLCSMLTTLIFAVGSPERSCAPTIFQWKGTFFCFFLCLGGRGLDVLVFLYFCLFVCLFVVAGVLWVAGIFESRLNKRKRRTSFELSNVFEGLLFGSDSLEGNVPQRFENFDQNIRRLCCDILGDRRWTATFLYMDVSENSGTPKSSILIGVSMIFTIHFGGPSLFLETPIKKEIPFVESFRRCSSHPNLPFRAVCSFLGCQFLNS